MIGDLVFVAAADRGLTIYRLTPQFRLNPPTKDGHDLRLSWLSAPGADRADGVRLRLAQFIGAKRFESGDAVQVRTIRFHQERRPQQACLLQPNPTPAGTTG